MSELRKILGSIDWWPLIGIAVTAIVAIYSTLLELGAEYLVPLMILGEVWWVLGYNKVDTKERGVKTLFGAPYATCESGLRWIPFLLGNIRRFTTEVEELEFPHEAGIVTREGVALDSESNPIANGRTYGHVNVGVIVSLLFQYPKGDDLIKAAKLLPAAKADLVNLFEEPVLDWVRTIGGDTVWINLAQRRAHFSRQVLESLIRDPGSVVSTLVTETGLTKIQIAIKHLNFPTDIMAALNAHETAELNRKGVTINAEAKARATRIEGAATIAVRRGLLRVIRLHPGNLEAQALLTLIEMAQGPATTIFPLSTDLTNALGRVLHRRGPSGENTELSAVWEILTETQKKDLLNRASAMLNPKTTGDVK